MRADLRERFERFVSRPNGEEGCWVWTGAVNGSGYGWFRAGKQPDRAHRVAFALAGGTLPEGFVLDHTCRVRHCVNPAHLRAVTRRQNTLAEGSLSPSKANAEKTKCVNGHEYSGRNVYRRPGGNRDCRACHAIRERRNKALRQQRILRRLVAAPGGFEVAS